MHCTSATKELKLSILDSDVGSQTILHACTAIVQRTRKAAFCGHRGCHRNQNSGVEGRVFGTVRYSTLKVRYWQSACNVRSILRFGLVEQILDVSHSSSLALRRGLGSRNELLYISRSDMSDMMEKVIAGNGMVAEPLNVERSIPSFSWLLAIAATTRSPLSQRMELNERLRR